MPDSVGSPWRYALTKNWTLWLFLIGKSDRGWMLYETVPSLPVGASVGVELTIGVERMKTSAPLRRIPSP